MDRKEYEEGKYNSSSVDFPVISKPINGARGEGVALNIMNGEDLQKGLTFSFEDPSCSRAVVQEQIDGEDHRIIVVNGKVEAVTKRIPPFIIGDGKLTIKELIDIENQNPLRGDGGDHDAAMSQILIDSESDRHLKSLGYSYDDILNEGVQINVRENANLSSGGLALDLTDEIHEEIKQEAIKIAKACKLGFCGVDYFCKDISLGLKEGKGAIIEINATPGIRMHHFPSIGTKRDVAGKILDAVFAS